MILLLLFVYVFGGTLGAGLGAEATGRAAYVDYVMPGILLIAIAGSAQSTAISVAMDMQEGIITRFRTMGIARASVLTAHVLGSTIQTIAGLAVVVVVAILVGFRPDASPIEWVATVRRVGVDHAGDHVVLGRARAVPRQRGGGEQPADAADPAAVPEQRVRAGRLDAGGPCAGSPSSSRSRRSSRRCAGC